MSSLKVVLRSAVAATALGIGCWCVAADPIVDRTQLPISAPPFAGVANRTLEGSKPQWARRVQAPQAAPNVILVLIDDAGFGNPSAFGGPINTPGFDQVAASGLRYNRFHVTALCSPSRAALLSGRNQHALGFGSIAELAGGWPGYNAQWPRSAASIATILGGNGYCTAAFGKWHLTPASDWGPGGPFDRWPTGLGFDYFWGFLGGDTDQYQPLLFENTKVLGSPAEKDFYLNTALADRAIDWMRQQKSLAPERPFFIYFATGASHAPHQVPSQWSAKYKGKFDAGWDKYRETVFARRKSWASFRRPRSSRHAIPRSRPGIRFPSRRRSYSRGRWKFTQGFRRTPTTRWAACSAKRGTWVSATIR